MYGGCVLCVLFKVCSMYCTRCVLYTVHCKLYNIQGVQCEAIMNKEHLISNLILSDLISISNYRNPTLEGLYIYICVFFLQILQGI